MNLMKEIFMSLIKKAFVMIVILSLIFSLLAGCGIKKNSVKDYLIIGVNGDTCYYLDEAKNKVFSINLTGISLTDESIGSRILIDSNLISISNKKPS